MTIFSKRSIVGVAAGFALLAGIGCAPSPYKLQYPKLVEENKQLNARDKERAQTILKLYEEIDYLKNKMKVAEESMDAQAKAESDQQDRQQAILQRLRGVLKGSPCEVELRGEKYVIVTHFTFESGKAELNLNAKSDLKKIGATLAATEAFADATFLVAGHADTSPIRESKYDSNWQLSGERARSVMQYLVEDCNIPAKKIGYAGFGEYRPVASNASPEGREKNRRVEIIVTP